MLHGSRPSREVFATCSADETGGSDCTLPHTSWLVAKRTSSASRRQSSDASSDRIRKKRGPGGFYRCKDRFRSRGNRRGFGSRHGGVQRLVAFCRGKDASLGSCGSTGARGWIGTCGCNRGSPQAGSSNESAPRSARKPASKESLAIVSGSRESCGSISVATKARVAASALARR
jgi:hypothetical protein